MEELKPLVGVSASVLPVTNARFLAHAVGEKNIDSLDQFAGCIPVIVPALGSRLDVDDFVAHLDGVLLTGGRANVLPEYFGGEPFPEDEVVDRGRDETVLPLVRAAVRAGVPVFGICRGIQEINVALGGTLHYRIHTLPGKGDHRMPQHDDATMDEIFELRHAIQLTQDGYLAELAGTDELHVNSLHGQGIDEVAAGLVVEAVSPDGVIEAIRLENAQTFTVGVQWHAEWEPENHLLSRRLFEEFGEAARRRAKTRR